jgi:hypothetical protein
MHRYTLNDTENATLEKWLNTRAVKSAIKKGAKLSLTFHETGIGLHIMAELDKGAWINEAFANPPPSKDITDYGSW